jgi:hypothetical protein
VIMEGRVVPLAVADPALIQEFEACVSGEPWRRRVLGRCLSRDHSAPDVPREGMLGQAQEVRAFLVRRGAARRPVGWPGTALMRGVDDSLVSTIARSWTKNSTGCGLGRRAYDMQGPRGHRPEGRDRFHDREASQVGAQGAWEAAEGAPRPLATTGLDHSDPKVWLREGGVFYATRGTGAESLPFPLVARLRDRRIEDGPLLVPLHMMSKSGRSTVCFPSSSSC